MTPHQVLKDIFGFSDFRSGQKEIIDAILANKNILAVMPTGSGKSICYQIPAIIKGQVSIVISPLISLMQDQVNSINKNGEIAAFINSTLDYSQYQKVLQKVANNKINLIYLSPEKLNNPEFIETIKNIKPYYLFVDEAHCISEWGHNFRPSYRNIHNFAVAIGIKNISAFTATATPEVRKDIVDQLKFVSPEIFVFGFERENIALRVEKTKDKKERISKIIKSKEVPAIVYTSTRKHAEGLAEYLQLQKIKASYYHAGLSNDIRRIIQDDFDKNNLDVIVATNAFGMGIDKKDIGLVIHYNIPGSIENLYQEFGRAGRDGNESEAYLFYSPRDKFTQEFLITLNNPSEEQIRIAYDAILDYHRIAVNFFTEEKLNLDDKFYNLISSKDINPNLLTAILSILEELNYLKMITTSSHHHSFSYLIDQTKLKDYVLKLKNKELKEFILELLQYFGAVPFTREVNINFDELRLIMSIDRKSIQQYFLTLNQIGIINYTRPTTANAVKMLRERIPSNLLLLNGIEALKKIENAANKLNSIIEYCYTNDCRFGFILNYFGEFIPNYKCGKCDNCASEIDNSDGTNDYLQEIIVRTLNEFKGGISKQRIIGLLKGNSKSRVAKSISTYQSCSHYSESILLNSIDEMINKGKVKLINEKLFNDLIENLIDEEFDNSHNQNNYESTLELFNKLRQERNVAARKFSQQPELICSEKILRIIAKQRPMTPSEFLSIDGANQRMFNKIGSEFLEIIQEHNNKFEEPTIKNELPQHVSQTYQLIKKGYSLQEISNLLKVSESIVSIQIETIINFYPKENYGRLISKDEFELIKNELINKVDDIKEVKKGSLQQLVMQSLE